MFFLKLNDVERLTAKVRDGVAAHSPEASGVKASVRVSGLIVPCRVCFFGHLVDAQGEGCDL